MVSKKTSSNNKSEASAAKSRSKTNSNAKKTAAKQDNENEDLETETEILNDADETDEADEATEFNQRTKHAADENMDDFDVEGSGLVENRRLNQGSPTYGNGARESFERYRDSADSSEYDRYENQRSPRREDYNPQPRRRREFLDYDYNRDYERGNASDRGYGSDRDYRGYERDYDNYNAQNRYQDYRNEQNYQRLNYPEEREPRRSYQGRNVTENYENYYERYGDYPQRNRNRRRDW